MEKTSQHSQVTREFGLSSWSVDNRVSIYILSFLIALMGFFAYTSMPKENFPEIVIPTIYIGTQYPGNPPADIENLITRPIEKELNTLTGVNKISSTSVQDFSSIVVEFNFDVDPQEALIDVKDAVDRAKPELPTDLDKEPNIRELNFSEMPIMNINLSGNFNMDELKEFAEYLEERIENLPEISEVEIKGAQDREVSVMVDLPKMESLNISFNDIQQAIATENITISGGDILTDGVRRSIRVVGEFTEVSDMLDIIVKRNNQNIVTLRDIADVSFDFEERQSYARSFGLPVISLDVKKRSGENLLRAADKIKEILAEAKEEKFPSTLNVSLTNDQSRITKLQLDNLENSIISGVILVVLILLFFLGLRNSLFVGVAIPMSMLMGFMILHFSGVTLNLMVLFSLILALGMLVDNGIVVVENSYRLMQNGYSGVRAAKEGIGEVAWPIISSTATTLAAFVPLLFWNQLMGEFMKYLPITLIIVLASSLFVALFINPVLISSIMKVQTETKKVKTRRVLIAMAIFAAIAIIASLIDFFTPEMIGTARVIRNICIWIIIITLLNIYVLGPASIRFQNKGLVKIERGYKRLVTSALRGRNPYLYFGGTFLLLIFSLVLLAVRAPKVNFFPVNEPQYVNIYIETPLGTDIEETDNITRQIEERVFEILAPYSSGEDSIVESVIANVGEGTTDPMSGTGPAMGQVTPNRAKVTIAFVESEYRNGISTAYVMEQLRSGLDDVFPGVDITVEKNRQGPPVGKPINIEISGDDIGELVNISEDIIVYINSKNIPGIEHLEMDLATGKPELIVHVDRQAAKRFGVSTADIGQAIRTALFGREVSTYKEGEDDYPIMVRLNKDYRYDLQSLLDQKITFRDQASGGAIVQVPISAVADIEYTSSFGSVKRKDLDRVITIYSNVKEGYNATEINARVEEYMKDFEMPDGYIYRFTGEQEEQEKAQAFLGQALIIAIFLIFLIIVATFNSLMSPFIIMTTVIFSTIGVFLGLAIFKMDFIVIMTGIGIISLAGIVVNNAIVLIDFANLVRERKRQELGLTGGHLPDKDLVSAIIEAGETRLRPVLLTAITTVLGLVPLAIGLNINFFTLLRDWDPNIYIGGDNVVFWGPMAWTVIFGLTFATFLTLVLVPVMYLIAERFKRRFAGAG